MMAGLSTLAAASGAVQGLQQGTQNAEDTKRFLASLLQQRQQFDVTSGFESRRVGALEQRTGAEVRQMGEETKATTAKTDAFKLEYQIKKALYDADIKEGVIPAVAKANAAKAYANMVSDKLRGEAAEFERGIIGTEEWREAATQERLKDPLFNVREREAVVRREELATGGLSTDIKQRQAAVQQNLDLARQLAPHQVQEAETRNVQLLKSIEVLEAQLKSIPLADQLTQGKIIAQDIENQYAEIEHNSRMALAEATIAKIEADTGLTLENRDAVKVGLAQNDRRLDNDEERIRRQYPDITDIQNALSDSRKKGIDAEIYRLNADLIKASHAKDEGGIKAIMQQLQIAYAQLGLVPVFDEERDVSRKWWGADIHYVSELKALTGEPVYPYSPRTNGGDTGGTTGESTVNPESRVEQLLRAGDVDAAIAYGDANGVDEVARQRIADKIKGSK